jgi:hypothetical protein
MTIELMQTGIYLELMFWTSLIVYCGNIVICSSQDTIKVRLQLQSEGSKAVKIYSSSFDALTKIYSSEGIKGLQKGLMPAVLREGSKNLFRIGMYDPIMSILHERIKDLVMVEL